MWSSLWMYMCFKIQESGHVLTVPEIAAGKCAGQSPGGKIVGNQQFISHSCWCISHNNLSAIQHLWLHLKLANKWILYWFLLDFNGQSSFDERERRWEWDIIELSLDSTGDSVVSSHLPLLLSAGLSSDENSKHYGFKSYYTYSKWSKKTVEWPCE